MGNLMNPGRLDRKIIIQDKITETNSFGEEIETWEKAWEVWAEVIPLKGNELYQARQTIANIDTKFRIRYLPNIGPENTIVYDNRIYDIYSVAEIGRRRILEILATARAE